MNDSFQIASVLLELEIIACSLDDAVAAYKGGASRLEVTVRLDLAGLTPPADLVRQIVETVPVPIRAMLRDNAGFALSGEAELETLKERAKEFDALGVDGLVVGHVKDGRLDLEALREIIAAAPATRFTAHHAVEATDDPLAALRALRDFPSVDRVLVRGGSGTIAQRIERLAEYREAIGPEKLLIVGGDVTLANLKQFRDAGIRIFHMGRAVRSPETADGKVDREKVKAATMTLGSP